MKRRLSRAQQRVIAADLGHLSFYCEDGTGIVRNTGSGHDTGWRVSRKGHLTHLPKPKGQSNG